MKVSVTVFALQLGLAIGSGVASASELEMDFPDAEENGYEEVAEPAAPKLVAAPVEVRLIPMTPRLLAAPVQVRLVSATEAAAPKPAPKATLAKNEGGWGSP
jgi:hypothetical protein